MLKNKKRVVTLTGIAVLLAILLVVIFHKDETGQGKDFQSLVKAIIYGKFWKTRPDEANYTDITGLPSCGKQKELFTFYPVALENIDRVTPQGEFSPSAGHVFPIKHVYTLDKYTPRFSTPGSFSRPRVDMVAPADMWITLIEKYWDKGRGEEYYVSFRPCQEIYGVFFHMSDISPKLKTAFESEKDRGRKETEDVGYTHFETIRVPVKVEVKAGEVIGTASVKSSQLFDFNLIDTRTPELQFINKERFSKHLGFDLLHEVCPYDYYPLEIRNKLYSIMSDYMGLGKKRTVEPLCGEYMQDVPNTAQGVWFKKGTANGEAGEENIIKVENLHLALAHEAFDPQRPAFSVGVNAIKGVEALVYYIKTQPSGLVNRDWRDIASDGKVYCFELFYDNYSSVGKSLILQMPTPTTLKIEKLNSSTCSGNSWSFTEKAVEFER